MDKHRVLWALAIFLIIVSAIFIINSIIYVTETKSVTTVPAESKQEAPVEKQIKENLPLEIEQEETVPVEMEAPIKPGEPLLQ